MQRDWHEANRKSWNAATRVHNSHKKDQAGFLRGGGSTLYSEELTLLGDVRGQSLLHLQCNSGQDTLSLASRCGVQVTGVDISDEAIAFAQQLSADSGIPGTFVREDVYDYLARVPASSQELVFCSYGWIGWLSDLSLWARGVAAALRPGGRLVSVEFHPFSWVWDEELQLKYPYGGGQHLLESGVRDYVGLSGTALAPMGLVPGADEAFVNPHPSHEFTWGLGDLVTALIDAGLQLQQLREYPYSNGCAIFRDMQPLEGDRYGMPPGVPSLPLMFGLVARKP